MDICVGRRGLDRVDVGEPLRKKDALIENRPLYRSATSQRAAIDGCMALISKNDTHSLPI